MLSQNIFPPHLSSHRDGALFNMISEKIIFVRNDKNRHGATDRISTHHGGFHDSLFLSIDELVQDDFICPIPNVVHPGNPFHLIFCFQLLGNPLLLCQLRNKLLLHFLRLAVNFFQVGIQCCLP